MRPRRRIAAFTCFLFSLGGCSRQAAFEAVVPSEEVRFARQLFSQLAAKEFDDLERQFDPSVRAPSARKTFEQMAAMIPDEAPKSVETVGSILSIARGETTYDLTLEYEFSKSWLLVKAVLRRAGGSLTVLGLHVRPMTQSLEQLNRFTFDGKGPLHFIVFGLVFAVPLFIVYALVVCLKTRVERRKWLWLLFVAVGLVRLTFNWSDGASSIQPISFALLGAGFLRLGPSAPWIFHVAIPVGAIVFLAKRRSLEARDVD